METYQGKHPACFKSRKAYELWLDSKNTETDLTAQYCTDCLPSFKMRMAKCGQCAHPETIFSFEPSEFDGLHGVEIVGHWKRIPVLERKVAPQESIPEKGPSRQRTVAPALGLPAVATPAKKPKPEKPARPNWKPSFFDLRRAIVEGFDIDPTPITAADMTEICRTDGLMKVDVQEVLRVMRSLWAIDLLEKGPRLCPKRQCTVDHFWGKAWKEAT